MRNTLVLSGAVWVVLLVPAHALAKQTKEDVYQAATVVSVKRHVSASNYAGDNPSDAPLQARDYSYDIGIRLNCNIYVGRYESATSYLPSVFVSDHEIEVRLHKHILYVDLPFSYEEARMGIVAHRRATDEVCRAERLKESVSP